ncbi:hypothetical protein R3P38DRAFT_2883716 [Favolaschia claudopus]|uniref:F-box domain-containing protein n=1 Tax=Favolaschia claudopus TaxID=2862362 RepID=A0AAW0CXJ9_9AGAR
MKSPFTSSLLPTPDHIMRIRAHNRLSTLPTDTSGLRHTISAAPAELAQYDAEIVKLTNELSRLSQERRTLASYADACRSALSPVHRLPNELLVEIFGLCFPEDLFQLQPTTTGKDELDRISHRYLLDLAHTCCRWYHVVEQTPELWAVISVDTALWDESPAPADVLLAWLEIALHRGQGFPLVLGISVTSDRPAYTEAVLRLLCGHSNRWLWVALCSDDEPEPSRYLASVKGKLNQLVTLALESSWNVVVDFFQDAPSLQDFTFSGNIKCLPKLPWHQIQTSTVVGNYGGHGPSYSPLSFLLHAINVETFTFRLDLRDYSADTPWNQISSTVEDIHFVLGSQNSRAVGQMFDSLTLPCLTIFKISPWIKLCAPLHWPSDEFLSLAERSGFGTHLISFNILHAIVAELDLLRCLAVLPQLEHLAIQDFPSHSMTDVFLKGLTCSAGRISIVPKLCFLDLVSTLQFTDAVYIELMISRAGRLQSEDRNATFTGILRWLPMAIRAMPNEAVERLEELKSTPGLVLEWGPALA